MGRTVRVIAALGLAVLPGTTAHAAAQAVRPPGAAAPAVPAPAAPVLRQGAWTGTWETAPSGTTPALPGAAIRNVVHLSTGGTAVRVRLSNRLGTAPLRLGAVTVALRRAAGPDAAPGTLRTATFHGSRTTTVAPGHDLLTDPVPLPVRAGADLLVTVHTPDDDGPATFHRQAMQTSYVARAGAGRAHDESGAAYTTTTGSWYYVTGVDVRGSATGSVVAFGDSLTDGIGATTDADHRWPDRLAEHLRARGLGVLNAGISGNRLLRDDVGPSGLSRLGADALDRAGVRVLVVFEGINDINTPGLTGPTALTDAYRTLVARAHARGIRVIGVTLTPYRGHRLFNPAREALRQQVNAFIRTGGAFDAVADADAALRDPADPQRLLPGYDHGDHLHFNEAGLLAVADAVGHVLDHRPASRAALVPAVR